MRSIPSRSQPGVRSDRALIVTMTRSICMRDFALRRCRRRRRSCVRSFRFVRSLVERRFRYY